MILVVCVDDQWGMSFNGRRQSRDKAQRRHLIEMAEGAPIWMNEYTGRLFRADGYLPDDTPDADYRERQVPADIRVADDYLRQAGRREYAFAEMEDVSDLMDRVEGVIVYKWGRQYASDRLFPRKVLKKFKLAGSETFKGTSHENISCVRYRR